MKRILSILVIIMVLLISGKSDADQADRSEDRAVLLEPIVVTASRGQRQISEVPASVTVITEREIEDSHPKAVPEVLKSLEGIYTYDSSGVGTTGAVNMRGFFGGMSSYQLVLLDGIPQNKGKDKLVDWDLISVDNIERIEVVRGAASALYGDNAMAGVINIITKAPGEKPEVKFFGSSSNFNTWDYGAQMSATCKGLGYFFDIDHKNTDGFRRNSYYRMNHVNGKVNYNITGEQIIKTSFDYYEKDRGALPWALSEPQLIQDPRQARPGTEDDKSDETNTEFSLTHSWDMGNNATTEETFYYRYDKPSSFYTSGASQTTTVEQLEDEGDYGLLLKATFNPTLFWLEHFFTAGIDLERIDFDYEEFSAPYQVRGAIKSNYGVKRYKSGPYIQDEINIPELLLRITAGVRYDWTEFDFDNRRLSTLNNEVMSRVTPKCGVVFAYQKDSSAYFNYAQAFRTPTIGQMFTYGSSANPDLQPENATNYEVGIRHRFDDRLSSNITLYSTNLINEIWYNYTTKKYANYGKTSHKGVEAGIDVTLFKGLSGFANYTYTRARNDNGDYAGEYLTNIPIHKTAWGMNLATDFGLNADLLFNYVGVAYIDASDNVELPAYTTVDVAFNYKYKWAKLFFTVDNVFDRKYNSYGYVSGRTNYFNPTPGRTYTLGGELKF